MDIFEVTSTSFTVFTEFVPNFGRIGGLVLL